MRRALCWFCLLASVLAACTKDAGEVPATALIVRVSADVEVQSSLRRVRLRTAGSNGQAWALRSERSYQAETLQWPIDLVLVPSSDWSTSNTLEIVIEALDAADQPLVQARVLTSFVEQQTRIVTVSLARCGAMALGELCEANPDCYGPSCLTCVQGNCQQTPMTSAVDLPALLPEIDAGNPGSNADAGEVTSDTGQQDARTDSVNDATSPGTMDSSMQGDVQSPVAPADASGGDTGGSVPLADGGGLPPADGGGLPVSEICRGAANSKVCDGTTLTTCDANGQIAGTSSCLSTRHCQVGTTRGKCPTCLEGEFHCEGAALQRCGSDGEWVTAQTCSTAALCSETAHACTSAFCAPKAPSCQGDMLQVCNDTQTAFQDVKKCNPGLCDRVVGECDLCVPDSKACEADGRSVRTCASNGQTSSVAGCASDKPLCTGSGNCVQCKQTSDCSKPNNECLQASCNVAAGSCGTAARNAHTACAGGVCDGSGNCIGCVDHSDCTARSTTLKYCSGASCVACTADAHCNQAAHEACKNNRCVVQPWCGDGMVSGGETCDPKANFWNVYTCSESCVPRNLYQPCSSPDECSAQGGTCQWGYCNYLCANGIACPASPMAGLTAACTSDNFVKLCFLKGCTSHSQCPKGSTCRDVSPYGRMCIGCETDADCPSGLRCSKAADGAFNSGWCG